MCALCYRPSACGTSAQCLRKERLWMPRPSSQATLLWWRMFPGTCSTSRFLDLWPMTRSSWCEQLLTETTCLYVICKRQRCLLFPELRNNITFVCFETAGTRGPTTPPSQAMQWTLTLLRSIACLLIPTVSSSWPLALQIRLVHSIHYTIRTYMFLFFCHEMSLNSGNYLRFIFRL